MICGLWLRVNESNEFAVGLMEPNFKSEPNRTEFQDRIELNYFGPVLKVLFDFGFISWELN